MVDRLSGMMRIVASVALEARVSNGRAFRSFSRPETILLWRARTANVFFLFRAQSHRSGRREP
jgi:hypothetical protein